MRPHTWAVEMIDGGPVGEDEVYRCTVCGCCGGGTSNLRGHTIEPKPFLPGPALDLADDCDVAHRQTLFFVQGYLSGLYNRVHSHEKAAYHMLVASNRWTPLKVPRVEFLNLIGQAMSLMSDEKLRTRLVGMGFKLQSTVCIDCGRPTDRPGDDATARCYQCEWHRTKPKGSGVL